MDRRVITGSIDTVFEFDYSVQAEDMRGLYEKAKRPDMAARYYRELAAAYGDVVCREDLTGQQLADRAAEGIVKAYLGATWPAGRVEVNDQQTGGGGGIDPRVFSGQRNVPISLVQFAGAAPRGLKVQYEQTLQIGIRNGLGEPLTFASLRASDGKPL